MNRDREPLTALVLFAADESVLRAALPFLGRSVEDSSADPRNHLKSDCFIRGRIGYEYRDREPPSIRQRNQSYVIGSGCNTIIHVRTSAFVGDAGSMRKVGVQTAGWRAHPSQQHCSVFFRQR